MLVFYKLTYLIEKSVIFHRKPMIIIIEKGISNLNIISFYIFLAFWHIDCSIIQSIKL